MPANCKREYPPETRPPDRGIPFPLVLLLCAAAVLLGFTACNTSPPQGASISPLPPAEEIPSATPYQPIPWTVTPTIPPATPTATPPPYSLWIDPNLPESFIKQVDLPAEISLSLIAEGASWRLETSAAEPVSQWVYVLVAPFPTVIDGVSRQQISQVWKGKGTADFKGVPLMMAESTYWMLASQWGEAGDGAVEIIAADDLLATAWQRQVSWAILPFEALSPKWKVLTIDGLSPIQKEFDPDDYGLSLPISLIGQAPIKPSFPSGNRDSSKMTTLVMTGVTALVRATAFTMEQQGVTYPAKDIGDWLRQADITHISNEVPFAEDCPYPNPVQTGMVFCSDSKYIELLEYVGTDIVELTGDHFSDWGANAMLHTLKLYDQHDWPYYGGGANLEEGQQAAILNHNGNRLAFIGCNAKGGGYARASGSNPGAAACDFNWMVSEIKRLRKAGYIPIATFQHFEYYTYRAQANQVRDAQMLTKAGAVIVSGSQAHHPQAFEFADSGFIHHGLGNLFFDQLDVSTGARQAFIDRHIFYNGRHISTELLTIWFEDYARARPMTAEEREQLLNVVFQASGW